MTFIGGTRYTQNCTILRTIPSAVNGRIALIFKFESVGKSCPRDAAHHIAFTMPSVIFFASPSSIIVLSR